MNEKIQIKDYYDFFPPNLNRTGDIWRGLPNLGILNKENLFGLVVTPACDLAQRKTETLTYLPIITIQEYLCSPSFYIEIWQDFFILLTKLKLADQVNAPSRYELPLITEISEIAKITEEMKAKDSTKISSYKRVVSYVKYISQLSSGLLLSADEVGQIFSPGSFEKITKKIVTNAFRVDLHFLPFDQKPEFSSAIPKHSVVLFRYAISIPIEIVNEAQLSDEIDWTTRLLKLKRDFSAANLLTNMPIRLATLKDDFLSDLLSRYVSMQIRLGSRDFTDETIDQYALEVKDSK